MAENNPSVRNFQVKHRLDVHTTAVTVLKFSPDRELLASADEDGKIMVYETKGYSVVRNLQANASVRDVEWHPHSLYGLVAGCVNGEIVKITLSRDGPLQDLFGLEFVNGFVHMLVINAGGNQVAVAYATVEGMRVVIFTLDTFHGSWGNGRQVPMPNGDALAMSGYPLVRCIFFITPEILLVGFFPDTLGFKFYNVSVWPALMGKSIALRPGTLIGGSALSPAGDYLAVMNLTDGIDVYDIHHGELLSTVEYPLGERYFVGVVFLDEDTIIVGHSRGGMVVINWSAHFVVPPFTVPVFEISPLQTIAVAVIDGVLWVAVGSNPVHEGRGGLVLLNQRQEDTINEKNPPIRPQESSRFWKSVKYGLISSLVLAFFAPILLTVSDTPLADERNLPIFAETQARRESIPGSEELTRGYDTAESGTIASTTTEVRTVVVSVPAPTVTITTTRLVTIPGPITTSTIHVVERVTESQTRVITSSMPATECATRTLVELATQTVTSTTVRTKEVCTWAECARQRMFAFTFDICCISCMILTAWSYAHSRKQGADPKGPREDEKNAGLRTTEPQSTASSGEDKVGHRVSGANLQGRDNREEAGGGEKHEAGGEDEEGRKDEIGGSGGGEAGGDEIEKREGGGEDVEEGVEGEGKGIEAGGEGGEEAEEREGGDGGANGEGGAGGEDVAGEGENGGTGTTNGGDGGDAGAGVVNEDEIGDSEREGSARDEESIINQQESDVGGSMRWREEGGENPFLDDEEGEVAQWEGPFTGGDGHGESRGVPTATSSEETVSPEGTSEDAINLNERDHEEPGAEIPEQLGRGMRNAARGARGGARGGRGGAKVEVKGKGKVDVEGAKAAVKGGKVDVKVVKTGAKAGKK